MFRVNCGQYMQLLWLHAKKIFTHMWACRQVKYIYISQCDRVEDKLKTPEHLPLTCVYMKVKPSLQEFMDAFLRLIADEYVNQVSVYVYHLSLLTMQYTQSSLVSNLLHLNITAE